MELCSYGKERSGGLILRGKTSGMVEGEFSYGDHTWWLWFWENKGRNGGKLIESDGSRWWMLIGCETANSSPDWLRPTRIS